MSAAVLLACLLLGAVPQEAGALPITKAYIVFSNHFDMGYTKNLNGSCAGAVINEYFNKVRIAGVHRFNR